VCEIGDDNYQVRIETTVVVTKTLAIATPYVVLRWGYTGVSGTDYMEIKVVATPDTNDLILGMGVWSGSSWTGVSYSRRSVPDVHHLFLKVEPTETASSSVRIRAGVVHIGSGKLAISDQTVSLAGYSAASVVYVYVTDTGGISHSTTASNYVGKPLLAKVTIPVGGIIVASSIEDARCFLVAPAIPDGSTLERNTTSGKLQVKDGGIQYSHINSNVPDGTTIRKNTTTGRLETVTKTYVSSWFAVAANSSYGLTHNLGTTKAIFQIQFSKSADGSNPSPIELFFDHSHHDWARMFGGQVGSITSTTCVVKTAGGAWEGNYPGYILGGTGGNWTYGNIAFYTTGYYRIIAQALE